MIGFSVASDENSHEEFKKDGMNQKNISFKLGYQILPNIDLNINYILTTILKLIYTLGQG